ncbi:hypothetical protein HNQ40_001805 [Algisphaera agarilytica]|uniref:Uncharacterized protein n=1 Tax=Algisphaera agarilytica TaxID=1385975 RepID=A0A7X0H8Z4_9BACT|nr:hypothetical protein [Algisphaera agarilytica]
MRQSIFSIFAEGIRSLCENATPSRFSDHDAKDRPVNFSPTPAPPSV